MDLEHLNDAARKLAGRRFLERLPEGQEMMPVSLALKQNFPKVSREERKSMLKHLFEDSFSAFDPAEMEVDYGTLSVSGQTVNAKIDTTKIREIHKALSDNDIDIRPLEVRKLI